MRKLIILVLFISTTSFAITLNQVIEIAKKNSLQIKMNEADLMKVYQKIKEVKSNLYPTIQITGTFQKYDPNYITGLSLKNRYSASIGISQKLFDKTVFESLKVAKENIKLQNLIKKDTQVKIIDTAKKLYIKALYYKAVLKKKEDSLKYWEENYKFIKNQFKVGLTNKYNLYRVKAQYQLAKADVEKAKADYTKALIELKRFLFLDKIVYPEGNLKIISYEIPSKDNLKNNTQLKIITENIKIKEREKNFYASSNFPTVNLNLKYETYKTKEFPSLKETWKKGYVLTVSANWTIFDGFKQKSQVLQKESEKIKEKLNYKNTLNDLKKQYETTLEDIKSLTTQAHAYEENIKASEEALKLATERYKYKLTNIVDVLEAEKNYNDVFLQYLNIIYQIDLKIFDLQLLVGMEK